MKRLYLMGVPPVGPVAVMSPDGKRRLGIHGSRARASRVAESHVYPPGALFVRLCDGAIVGKVPTPGFLPRPSNAAMTSQRCGSGGCPDFDR